MLLVLDGDAVGNAEIFRQGEPFMIDHGMAREHGIGEDGRVEGVVGDAEFIGMGRIEVVECALNQMGLLDFEGDFLQADNIGLFGMEQIDDHRETFLPAVGGEA